MNSLDISSFLTPFFKGLVDADFLWCVARGWEGLPDYTRHDVDIYIERKGYAEFRRKVYEVASLTGWDVFRDCKKSIYRPILLYKSNDAGAFKFIQLDLFLGAVLKGVPSRTSFEAMLGDRWLNEKGIWCCNVGYMGVRVLLKELVQNGSLGSEKRERQVLESVSEDEEKFRYYLQLELRDKSLVEKIVEFCLAANWRGLESLAVQIKSNMPRLRLADWPRALAWSLASLKVRFRPFFRFFVVLVGPDGCGKTTVADAIAKEMDCNPFSLTYRIHSSFGGLPRLRNIYAACMRVLGKKVEFKSDPTPGTRHMGMQKPLSPLRAIFYVTYYGIGLIVSRIKILRMYPYFTMILADRYYYDYYYMRGYQRCPNWYKRIFEFFIPQPDLVLFLNRDAKRIYAQKPELSVEEIERQQAAIKRLVQSRGCFYEIDGNEGIEQTLKNVFHAISVQLTKMIQAK